MSKGIDSLSQISHVDFAQNSFLIESQLELKDEGGN